MKKLLLFGILLLAMAGVSFPFINMRTVSYDLLLKNVEALASSEDTGTPVKSCFKYAYPRRGYAYLECNSSTSHTMIYNCPKSTVSGEGLGSLYSCIDK